MIRGYTIGIVIPCHNEERGLRTIFPRVPQEVDEVIVVDNNSTDETAAVARAYGARVIFEREPGYGRAYQAGFAQARSEILVTLDGDGQYPVEDTPRLVGLFLDRNLDCLSGSRFPVQRGSMPIVRQVGNRLLTLAARVLFGVRMQDTQSGMWVFRRSILDVIHPRQPSMPFSEEFKLKVVLQGFRFGEEHIAYYQREGVSTLQPLRHGWENLRELVRLWWETRRPRRRQAEPARAAARVREHQRVA